MPRKKKLQQRSNYEAWSRGKSDAWMHGMGFIDTGYTDPHTRIDIRGWWFADPYYQAAECFIPNLTPVRGPKRNAIFDLFFKKIGGVRSAIVYDPFFMLREYRRTGHYHKSSREDREMIDKCLSGLLEQFPCCGSAEFNGALCLRDHAALAGLRTVWAMWDVCPGAPCHGDIILKDHHIHIHFCDHGGLHVAGRVRDLVEAYVRAYRHHTQIDLDVSD
jgi:hypothetical protein